MSEAADQRTTRPAKGRADRWVKLGFVAAAAIAAVAIIFVMRERGVLPDWSDNLDAALRTAGEGNRKVLVIFLSQPPGEITRQLATGTISKNRKAITDGEFVCVKAVVPASLDSDLARRYRIRTLPTMLILTPDGKEWNRREGMIGELPFRTGFLDGSKIEKPQ